MTIPEQPYLGDRLGLPQLRGEVTTVAVLLNDTTTGSPRARAAAWICGTMDEVAAMLRATLHMPAADRARLVADLDAAAEALYLAETSSK